MAKLFYGLLEATEDLTVKVQGEGRGREEARGRLEGGWREGLEGGWKEAGRRLEGGWMKREEK
jgi:hypothetical protein